MSDAANIATDWQVIKLAPEYSTLPIQKTEVMQWYQVASTNISVGVISNSKNSIEEKLVPYLQQSLVNDFWFLEKESVFNIADQSFTVQIIKSFNDNRRVIRLQLFKIGRNWTSSYTTAKVQQIPAVISGNNEFSYFLFLAECKSMSCTQTINDITQQANLVIAQ